MLLQVLRPFKRLSKPSLLLMCMMFLVPAWCLLACVLGVV
jgi:hypothetical protein